MFSVFAAGFHKDYVKQLAHLAKAFSTDAPNYIQRAKNYKIPSSQVANYVAVRLKLYTIAFNKYVNYLTSLFFSFI